MPLGLFCCLFSPTSVCASFSLSLLDNALGSLHKCFLYDTDGVVSNVWALERECCV